MQACYRVRHGRKTNLQFKAFSNIQLDKKVGFHYKRSQIFFNEELFFEAKSEAHSMSRSCVELAVEVLLPVDPHVQAVSAGVQEVGAGPYVGVNVVVWERAPTRCTHVKIKSAGRCRCWKSQVWHVELRHLKVVLWSTQTTSHQQASHQQNHNCFAHLNE